MFRTLALVLALVGGVANAANPARYRFHVVSDELVKKLSTGARRNERAVVAFPHATGFVVKSDPNRPSRVLILTNFHVAGGGPPAGDVQFRDGTVAHPIRTVVENPNLDYAVVEAELTSGPRKSGVDALELDRSAQPLTPEDRIYAIGAHTGLDIVPLRHNVAGGRSVERKIEHKIAAAKAKDPEALVGFRTIAVGKVLPNSKAPIWIQEANGLSTLGVLAEMPNAGGMSGSPVMSRDTHRVVGLHFSGGGPGPGKWEQSSVPIDLLLNDIRAALATNHVDTSARDLVQQLVDGP